MTDMRRGVLYPERLPEFHRLLPEGDVAALVGWFWIPEWGLPEGVVSEQHLLSYPALNLVVEPDGVALAGATTRVAARRLEGRGWAVGA
ncbi:MAG: AraC family transcriptional regulator, partial [Microbacterium sp.]